jgi:hypothetical protein
MLKLRQLISQLNADVLNELEKSLINSKADKFLFLLREYKKSDVDDSVLQENLKITSNSYYVLKSRLYDRIQEHLSGDIHASKEEVRY